MTLDRRIEIAERNALDAILKLQERLQAAHDSIVSGLRVHAGVSGDPGIVSAALDVDAAVRARQLLWDVKSS